MLFSGHAPHAFLNLLRRPMASSTKGGLAAAKELVCSTSLIALDLPLF
jgi:hypothetical protein